MTAPVQGDDAIRERERLAGDDVRQQVAAFEQLLAFLPEYFRPQKVDDPDDDYPSFQASRPGLYADIGFDRKDKANIYVKLDAVALLAALRASEPVPGAVGVSVEEIARSGDWVEDFSHENGNYTNRCVRCGNTYRGHKRRVICKTCDRREPSALTPRTVEPDPASGAADVDDHRATIEGIIKLYPPDAVHLIRNRAWWERLDAMLAARPSSPRDAGEAETVEQLRRERDEAREELRDFELNSLNVDHRAACREVALENRVADLERQIAGAGKAEMLRRLAAAQDTPALVPDPGRPAAEERG